MNPYTPENPFQTTEDSKLVYNLRSTGFFHKGTEEMQNDVAISIHAPYVTDEQRAHIARVINEAMNEAYPSQKPMKIIFLDVDGVLSSMGLRGLCRDRIDMFADIVRRTGAEVVLSSTWRYPRSQEQRARLEQELRKRGVTFLGMTPILDKPVGTTGIVAAAARGKEIATWLETARDYYTISSFVILDDDPGNEMGDLSHALVKCDGYKGLTQEVADEVVRRLTDGPEINTNKEDPMP